MRISVGMETESIQIDKSLIEEMVTDLFSSQALLQRERDAVDAKIKGVGDRIILLQSKLKEASKSSDGKPARLRKGEGVQKILAILSDGNGIGLSQVKICEKTGIPGATVYRLLTKNGDKFQLGTDSLWRKK